MHARHRNPGNGYRSNSMGMGMGRISPEGSLRGHGYYNNSNSEPHRNNFNRGGFGRSKSFQPPPPPPPPPPAPPRKGDIFMDAGRLAAEYLVGQGLLPPSVLSAKWQKKQQQQQQQIEFPESDHMRNSSEEGRTSALARLGNSVSEGGYRRGRFGGGAAADEFTTNTRNKGRRRNRGGFGSDWSRDYGRSGSFSDRHSRASSEDDSASASASARHEEHKLSRDVGNGYQQNPTARDLAPESEDAVDSESKLDKGQYPDEDMSSKPTSSGARKDGPNGTDEVNEEPTKVNDIEMEDKDCANNVETEKQTVAEDLPVQIKAAEAEAEAEGDCISRNGTDLLKLCKFAKVPTRIRSALSTRSLKIDPLPSIQEGNPSADIGLQLGASQALVENSSLDVSSGTPVLDKAHYANCVDPETSKLESNQSVENLVESGSGFGIEHNKFARSRSLPDRAFVHENEQELSKGPAGLRSFSFVVKERGEKRALEDYDKQVEAKKPRDWLPYMAAESDDCFQISNLSERKTSPLEDNTSPGEKVIVAVDHEGSVGNDSQFRKDGAETCIDYMQEKQLFPNFDLNLIEVSDAHENRDSNPVLNYPDVSGVKKEAAPVDIDLSMSNSNMSRENSRRSVDVKEIEVIDLENDSIPEDKAFNNAERKTGTEFIPLDGFSNQAQNSSDVPDAQDGYGLMISELLVNDFPTCSSVPEDLTPLPNDIGLPNTEGTLADDDSIYMALGEIPLTFMRPWEQPPPQEYEKPF